MCPLAFTAAHIAEAGALKNEFSQIRETISEHQWSLEYGVGSMLRSFGRIEAFQLSD